MHNSFLTVKCNQQHKWLIKLGSNLACLGNLRVNDESLAFLDIIWPLLVTWHLLPTLYFAISPPQLSSFSTVNFQIWLPQLVHSPNCIIDWYPVLLCTALWTSCEVTVNSQCILTHVRMLWTHCEYCAYSRVDWEVLAGLPLILLPAVMPCMMVFSRLVRLIVWPKYLNFLFLSCFISILWVCSSSRTLSFVLWSFQDTRSSLRYAHISNASTFFVTFLEKVQDSLP